MVVTRFHGLKLSEGLVAVGWSGNVTEEIKMRAKVLVMFRMPNNLKRLYRK
jgi:hypothetical protein